MSSILTSKIAAQKIVQELLAQHAVLDDDFVNNLHRNLLTQKVKFPILESVATFLYPQIPAAKVISFTDLVISKNETGSYVIAGKMLQLHLQKDFTESIKAAKRYIVFGDAWYVCDIVGERVFGYGMLTQPERMLPVLNAMPAENTWLVRAIGVAVHYAVKKKLERSYAEKLFELLLTLSGSADFHTKKGIGWGAKTIAKFHPDIIAIHKVRIADHARTGRWFRSKITTGLGRSWKYATND